MNAKVESAPSALDNIKLVLAAGVLLAGIAGFEYFSDQSLLYRVLGLVAVAAVAAAIAMTSAQGRNAWIFFRDARNEVRKVIWPTRQETLQTTLIVLAMVVLVALILWAMDALFLELVQWLLNLNRGS